MIEILEKKTGKVTEVTIENYLNEQEVGIKGKLNLMIDLAKGEIFQSPSLCFRLKNLKEYKFDWRF